MKLAHFLVCCFLALPLGVIVSGEKGKDADEEKKELERWIQEDKTALQGTWVLVRLELNGREDYPGPFKKPKKQVGLIRGPAKLVFDKDKVRWNEDPPTVFKLHPGKKRATSTSSTKAGPLSWEFTRLTGPNCISAGVESTTKSAQLHSAPAQETGCALWSSSVSSSRFRNDPLHFEGGGRVNG
jgi:hypothetical protein